MREVSPNRLAGRLDLAYGVLFLLLVSMLSLTFYRAQGTPDVGDWQERASRTETSGLREGYVLTDYPPLSNVLLFAITRTSKALGTPWFLVLKGTLLLFLWLTTAIFLAWKRDLILAAILQLALLLNSVGLCYLDILFAPTLLLSFWALERKRVAWFCCFFSITCLIKWQPVILLPLIVLHLLKPDDAHDAPIGRRLARLLFASVPGWVSAGACIGFFGLEGIYTSFKLALSNVFLSGNALNATWILTFLLHWTFPGNFKGPPINPNHYSLPVPIYTTDPWLRGPFKLMFFLTYAALAYEFLRRKKSYESLLLYCIVAFLAYGSLNVGVHENHLFVACLLAPILWAEKRAYMGLAAVTMLFPNINMLLFYGINGRGLPFPPVFAIDQIFSVLNMALLIVALWHLRAINAGDREGEHT